MTPDQAGPTTGAGRALAITHPQLRERVMYIEAEARADGMEGERAIFQREAEEAYGRGRADALREAAERVRALDAWFDQGPFRAAVIAILDPDPGITPKSIDRAAFGLDPEPGP